MGLSLFVRLDPALEAELRSYAKAVGATKSGVTRRALEVYLSWKTERSDEQDELPADPETPSTPDPQ